MTQDNNANLESLRLPELQARYEQVLGKPTRCPNRTYLIRSICGAVQGDVREDALESEEPARSQDDTIVLSDDDVEDVDDAENTQNAGDKEPASLGGDIEPAATTPAEPDEDEESAATASRRRERRPKPERQPRGRFSGMTVEELQRMYVEVVGRETASSSKAYLCWKIREAEKGRIPIGPRRTRTRQGEPADVKILPLRLEADTVAAMDNAWRARGIKTRMEFLRRALGHYLTHIGAGEAAARFGNGSAQ